MKGHLLPGAPSSTRIESGGRVVAVQAGSAAYHAGLRPGDVLLAVNNHALHDVLDYQFYCAEDELELRYVRDGSERTARLGGGAPLGLEFADPTFDGIYRCRNRCPFCFVSQLPRGMRRGLYVKDDDYRYSVAYGGFVTLTNLSEDDWRRLAEQHLGPLRVSVHATDLALRRQLLGNPRAPDVMDQLRRLGSLGLRAHTQLVLVPGVNDGPPLDRSIRDLVSLYPVVQSIAAVPVGLTRQTTGPGLRPYGREEADAVVRLGAAWQRLCRTRFGRNLVHLADEFYFLAERPFPSGRRYDGYPQYQNGVGLVRSLLDEWARVLHRGIPRNLPSLHVTIFCGTRIAGVLSKIAADISLRCALRLDVVPVANGLFGPTVNVSGLLAGRDVLNGAESRHLGDLLVLPRVMLDDDGERFLDDLTPADLEARLGRPVAFATTTRDLLNAVSLFATG